MHYVASYLLATLRVNSSPSTKDTKKILDSVGMEADDDQLNKFISEAEWKKILNMYCSGCRQAHQCACWWLWLFLLPHALLLQCLEDLCSLGRAGWLASTLGWKE